VTLQVDGSKIEAYLEGKQIFAVVDAWGSTLAGGGVGLVVDTGSIGTQAVHITPL
jgi:hypothetical protein